MKNILDSINMVPASAVHHVQLWEILYLLFIALGVCNTIAACYVNIRFGSGLSKIFLLPTVISLFGCHPTAMITKIVAFSLFSSMAPIGAILVIISWMVASNISFMIGVYQCHDDFKRRGL